MIQRRCGYRRRGRSTEAFAFTDVSLKDIDEAATNSLKGEGKNKMRPTYGTRRFNSKPPENPPQP